MQTLISFLLNLFRKSVPSLTQKAASEHPPAELEELLTIPNLKNTVESLGYVFFDSNKRMNLNLIGIRRNNAGTNKFDDYMAVIYRNSKAVWTIHLYEITTDPGEYWLENPINPSGTAILPNGQYRASWEIGKHQGKYEALVQRKKVPVWRDNDKDNIIDYARLTVPNFGFYGINIHRSNPYNESYLVGRWSAGCQVFKKVSEYDEFLGLCREAAGIYGNSFTYTLLTEEEIRKHTIA